MPEYQLTPADAVTLGGWFNPVGIFRDRGIVLMREYAAGWALRTYTPHPDGSLVRSATITDKVPDAAMVASDDVVVLWSYGLGWSSVLVEPDGDPVWVTQNVTPHAAQLDNNNVVNWTVYEDTLYVWGRQAHPATGLTTYSAPVNPTTGVIGSFTSLGAHTITTIVGTSLQHVCDYQGGRGGSLMLADAPDVNLFSVGEGNGHLRLIDMTSPLVNDSDVTPPAGSATTDYPDFHVHSYRRGPGGDHFLMHRDNLTYPHLFQEWEWTGTTFAVAGEWMPPDPSVAVPGADTGNNPSEFSMKLGNGVVVVLTNLYDTDFNDHASMLYVDAWDNTERQTFTLGPTTHDNRFVALVPVEMDAKALLYSFEFDGADSDTRFTEQWILLEPVNGTGGNGGGGDGVIKALMQDAELRQTDENA